VRARRVQTLRLTDSALGRQLLGTPWKARRELYECPDCRADFIEPMPTQDELLSAYRRVPDTVWPSKWQAVWDRVADELALYAQGPRVADAGCYTGEFLAGLPGEWERFGMEPAPRAAEQARARGITVIGDTVESLGEHPGEFDAVLMLDLLEHLPNPTAAVRLGGEALRAGGVLLALTGNMDAPSCRAFRGNHHYYRMPGHVVFLRPAWFRWAAPGAGLTVAKVVKVRHSKWSLIRQIWWLTRHLAYWPLAAAARFGLDWRGLPWPRPVRRFIAAIPPPYVGHDKDHILVVMQRPED
jgi:SAM-dependent methyltransferase